MDTNVNCDVRRREFWETYFKEKYGIEVDKVPHDDEGYAPSYTGAYRDIYNEYLRLSQSGAAEIPNEVLIWLKGARDINGPDASITVSAAINIAKIRNLNGRGVGKPGGQQRDGQNEKL